MISWIGRRFSALGGEASASGDAPNVEGGGECAPASPERHPRFRGEAGSREEDGHRRRRSRRPNPAPTRLFDNWDKTDDDDDDDDDAGR